MMEPQPIPAGATPAQVAVLKRADAMMQPAMDLYNGRNELFHMVARLPLRDLRRLVSVLRRMTDEDLRRASAFAEGLAEWSSGVVESPELAAEEAR